MSARSQAGARNLSKLVRHAEVPGTTAGADATQLQQSADLSALTRAASAATTGQDALPAPSSPRHGKPAGSSQHESPSPRQQQRSQPPGSPRANNTLQQRGLTLQQPGSPRQPSNSNSPRQPRSQRQPTSIKQLTRQNVDLQQPASPRRPNSPGQLQSPRQTFRRDISLRQPGSPRAAHQGSNSSNRQLASPTQPASPHRPHSSGQPQSPTNKFTEDIHWRQPVSPRSPHQRSNSSGGDRQAASPTQPGSPRNHGSVTKQQARSPPASPRLQQQSRQGGQQPQQLQQFQPRQREQQQRQLPVLHVDEVILSPCAADRSRSPQPKPSNSPSAGTPRSKGPAGQAGGSSTTPTAAAADIVRVSSISLVADGGTASLAAAAAQHDMRRKSIAGHRDPAALTLNPERPTSSSSMAQGVSVSASGGDDTAPTVAPTLQAATVLIGPPASGTGASSHRSTLDTGASDDGLTVQVSQMSGLIMQQLAAGKTLQQQQQEQIALQQQRQQLGSGSEPGGRWRFIRPSLEHRLLQATKLLARLAGKSPTIREMQTPASSNATTPGVNSVEAPAQPALEANTAAAAAETALTGAAAAGAELSGQAGVTGGGEGAGSVPALSQVERWKAYRVTLEEHLNAATTVLASTGHLPEWLASARTTRQSSTGDIPHVPPRRMSRMGSNTNSNAAAALGATGARAQHQHQHQHPQQQPQQYVPSLHIEHASEGSAVTSPKSTSSPKAASDRTSEATAVTESSGGTTDKDAGHVWLLERHLSKGGFGSLTFSQFVCAEEGMADEEKEVMSQLQQQLQLAEEVLRKHGLMQAYNMKLTAATSSAPGSSAQQQTSCMAVVAAGFCDMFCCGKSSTQLGAAEGCAAPLKTVMSPVALLLFLAYMTAAAFYIYTRASRITDLGYQWWYGLAVLLVEVIGVSSMLPYGLMLVCYTATTGSRGLPASKGPGATQSTDQAFHVRVLVPCYKEPLGVLRATLEAVLEAAMPPGCTRSVYLCDDGADPQKRTYAATIAHLGVMYVSGRARAPGEINGKSGNLNNALCNIIYQEYKDKLSDIPPTELVVVFDADMACKKEFFSKVLEVMCDMETALCLTPQAFSNVEASSDIWNHVNPQFWEYVLPGCDALGYVACTGTNVCIRSRCLAQVGWFPTYTITEDYALSQELKMAGFKGRYLPEYLAIGEAPEEVRAVMRQRSRWCKGHMQVFFSSRCPLFQRRLSFLHKMLYTNGTWAYFATILTSLTFTLVPFLSLVLGWHPVTFSRQFALASTLYLVASGLLTGYIRRPAHSRGMWLSGISNYLLAFTFAKAVINTLLSKIGFKDTAAFKATAKKLAPVKAAVMRAAAATVTAVATALHSVVGFVGHNTSMAARAASGMAFRRGTAASRRVSALGDATAYVDLHGGSLAHPKAADTPFAAASRGSNSLDFHPGRSSFELQVPAGAAQPAHRSSFELHVAGAASHTPRRASLLGQGARESSQAPHGMHGPRTPSQLAEESDRVSRSSSTTGPVEELRIAKAASLQQTSAAGGAAWVPQVPELTLADVLMPTTASAVVSGGQAAGRKSPEKPSFVHGSFSGHMLTPVVESPTGSALASETGSARFLCISQRGSGGLADGQQPAAAEPERRGFWSRVFGKKKVSEKQTTAQQVQQQLHAAWQAKQHQQHKLQQQQQHAEAQTAGAGAPGCCAWMQSNWDSLDGTLDPFALLAALFISLFAIGVGAQQAAAMGARFGVSNPSGFLSVLVSGRMDAFMVLAMLWAAVNAIPPVLFIIYFFTKGRLLRWSCHVGQLMGLLLCIAAIWCLWVLVPYEVSPQQVLPSVVAFLDAQRSGPVLPDSTTEVYPWLKPSAAGDAVAGGFYMGADYVKYSMPMATSLSLLAWSLVEFRSGYKHQAAVHDQAVDILAHGVKYLMKCHNAASGTFVVQIGEPADYVVDLDRATGFWGLPEHMPPNRAVYTITGSSTGGADALAAASAALAASAVAINRTRPMLAAQALTHARQLYDWASSSEMYNTSYCGRIVPCKGTAVPLYDEWTAAHEAIAGSTHAVEVPWAAYPSSSALDDLAWAGVWLHKATGVGSYLSDAEMQLKAHFRQLNLWDTHTWMPGLDNIGFAAGIMLQRALPGVAEYRTMPAALLRGWMTGQNKWVNEIVSITHAGFLLSDSGTPAHTAAHVGMLSLMFAAAEEQQGGKTYLVHSLECFAMKIATSLFGGGLGDQPSFVVGYGPHNNWPKRVHHRQASCPAGAEGANCSVATALLTSQANPNQLTGALVSGPDASGVFSDIRTQPQQTGVSLHGNVVLSGLLAGLNAREVQPGQCNGGRGFVQNVLRNFAP